MEALAGMERAIRGVAAAAPGAAVGVVTVLGPGCAAPEKEARNVLHAVVEGAAASVAVHAMAVQGTGFQAAAARSVLAAAVVEALNGTPATLP